MEAYEIVTHMFLQVFYVDYFNKLVRVGVMTGEEGKVSGIEKFDSTDFGYWRMQIGNYL